MYKDFLKFERWDCASLGKKYHEEVKKDANFVVSYLGFLTLLGFCCAVLYVIPSEDDKKIFFIMTWFEEHLSEWAETFSLFHRLTFLFVPFIMLAPCFQIAYLVKESQYQIIIYKNLLQSIHNGYENLEKLVDDINFQKEINRRLLFCIKRHIALVMLVRTLVTKGSIFVMLLSVTGGIIPISILMFVFLVRLPILVICIILFTKVIAGWRNVYFHLRTSRFIDICGFISSNTVYDSRTKSRGYCKLRPRVKV